MHSVRTFQLLTIGRTFKRSFHSSPLNQKDKKLEGRIAVGVGCTDGIGFAMARRLAEDGAHVIVSSRKQENVDRAVDQLRSEGLSAGGYAGNVASEKDRNGLLKNTSKIHGGFDILINNAGVNAFTGEFLKTCDSAFDKCIDVNLRSNFCLIRDAVPHMSNRKHQGSIVVTSSISGYRANDYASAYAVSKSAIFGLVKAFMPGLLERNIRINCVALGLFETEFGKIITCEEGWNAYKHFIPFKRPGQPSEAAGIASFLCSDDSSYVSGESFSVAGGIFSRL